MKRWQDNKTVLKKKWKRGTLKQEKFLPKVKGLEGQLQILDKCMYVLRLEIRTFVDIKKLLD